MAARIIDNDVSSPLVSLYSCIATACGSLILASLLGDFTTIQSSTDMAWIIALGGFGGTAVLLLIISYRMTEPSNLAPFSYFGIPLIDVFGWLFFNETPSDVLLFPRAFLIIICGLIIVWREHRIHSTKII